MATDNDGAIIYCLENPALRDGIVKIGRTRNLEARLKELYSTGVPLPFECALALKVKDAVTAERLLHEAFGGDQCRRNPKREFFWVGDVERVKAAMRLTGGEDVTPDKDVVEDEASRQALEREKERKKRRWNRFNFGMVNIPPGAVLTFRPNIGEGEDEDDPIKAEVTGKKIRMITPPRPPRDKAGAWSVGDELTLSGAATKIMNSRGHLDRFRGPPRWYYENESLFARRERMEDEGGDDD